MSCFQQSRATVATQWSRLGEKSNIWRASIGTYGIQKSSWWTWKNIDLFTENFIKMLSYLWWYLLPSLPLVWPLPLIDKGESRLHSTKCLVNIFSQDKSALHCCRLKPGCPQADFCWWVVTHISSLILLEAGLYKLGSMRYMAEKTSTNVYRCFHQEKHLSFPSSRLPNLDKDVFLLIFTFQSLPGSLQPGSLHGRAPSNCFGRESLFRWFPTFILFFPSQMF